MHVPSIAAFYRNGSLVLLIAASGLLSCGREATARDCETIVKRVAELELAAIAPGQDVTEEVRSTQAALHSKALSNCVGRRISDDALRCVREAKSAEELIDTCFD